MVGVVNKSGRGSKSGVYERNRGSSKVVGGKKWVNGRGLR